VDNIVEKISIFRYRLRKVTIIALDKYETVLRIPEEQIVLVAVRRKRGG
jgi:hypothetical protein